MRVRRFAVALGFTVLPPVGLCAQAAPAPSSVQSLNDALFVGGRAPVARRADPPARLGSGAQEGTFSTPDGAGQSLAGQPLFNPAPFNQPLAAERVTAAGQGLISWRSAEVSHLAPGGAVDTVRLSVADRSRPFAYGQPGDAEAVGVSFVRGWPAAVMMRAGEVGLTVSPHAGLGFGAAGGAEAGATFKVSSVKDAIAERLGAKDGASAFGDRGRLYLFAAVRGQAVGLNMLAGDGGLRRSGWSTDVSSALIGDGQIGVGWRKGGVEAAIGYVHRGVHVRNAPLGASDSYADDMGALSLTFHPHW